MTSGPSRVFRAGGGIIAQLDEPIGLLGVDAPGLLEAHPENPLGGLVVEDDRPRRVDDEHRHEEIARQLANEDHLHGLLRYFRGHHQTRRRRSTSAGKSLSSSIWRMGGMFRRRYGGVKG